MKSDPTVFIVDDDPDMRGALRYLIEGVGLAAIEYDNGRSFLNGYDGRRPACLVLDMRMPGMGGLELQEEILKRKIAIPVIMLTGFGDVPSAVRALKTGALEFVEKPFNNQELLDMIQRALETDARQQREQERDDEIQARLGRLTPREREVMEMVVSGASNKEIASALDIAIKTVEVHRAHVMEKTQAANLADLVNMFHQISKGKPLDT